MKIFRNKLFVISLTALIFCFQNFSSDALAQQQQQQLVLQSETFQFNNGQWFNGKTFKRGIFYSVNGLLTKKRPAKVDRIVDLKNGYVIPPFADAHCHNFDGVWNIKQQIEKYLTDGVFYAKVQTNTRSGANQVAGRVNIPTSVDVSYAHGALTASYGHGVEVYEGLAVLRKPGAGTPEEVQKIRASKARENDAYYIIDTAADLEKKWQMILDGKPSFLKIYLLTTEEYEKRRERTETIGDRGLNPALMPLIVKKAQAAGLRVSAHVDTITDYRVALKAGVDEMAHLPGYYVGQEDDVRKLKLTEKDAWETARRKIWVIPAPIAYGGMDKVVRGKTDEVLRYNLRLLRAAKARIAFGSDRYGNTPQDDVLYLAKLGVFSNLELLKIWTEDTPQTIFPNRRIGRLQQGYEASFIVLASNPLNNFGEVKNIKLRFKQGHLINVK
ncbi:MAG: amidohydrolase family protein [Pyrinomonadaceae bacterium]